MNNTENLVIIFSSLGVLNSIILSFAFLIKKERKLIDYLLFFLVLALVIRLGQSVMIHYFLNNYITRNIGVSAFVTIGPLLFLYLKYYTKKINKIKITDLIHFIPLVILLACIPYISYPLTSENVAFRIIRYYSVISIFSIYILCSINLLRSYLKTTECKTENKYWLLGILVGTALIWFSYYLNAIYYVFPYLTAPVIYSIIFYGMVYLRYYLNRKSPASDSEKYKNINITEAENIKVVKRIKDVVKIKKAYLEHSFSLEELAERVDTPKHILSKIINTEFDKNFPDLINSYRLEEAQQLLKDPEYEHIKIAAIAYGSGFNSLTVFNTKFKKHTGVTPSQFRSAKNIS